MNNGLKKYLENENVYVDLKKSLLAGTTRELEKYFKSGANEVTELIKEYELQKNEECKVVKLADKLDMLIQALIYENSGVPREELDEFWDTSKKVFIETQYEFPRRLYEELEILRNEINKRKHQ